MMRTISTLLAVTVVLCGCASQPTDPAGNPAAGGQQVADRGERTLGTLFPQKDKNRPNNSITANTQDMENQRIMQAGVNPTLK
jgi:hypothetical protein